MNKQDQQNLPALALVLFPVQTSMDNNTLRQLLESTGPAYTNVKGLRRKYFIAGDSRGGGVYEWESRARGEAFYDARWRQRMKERTGADPEITWFQLSAVADGVKHNLEIFLA